MEKIRLALAGANQLKVTLKLDSGVQLVSPELWRFIETSPGQFAHRKLKLNAPATSARAEWTFNTGGDPFVALKLYWDAIEPMQPTWPYNATIAVLDPSTPLAGKGTGQTNPRILACKIGPKPPHGGSEMVSIYAS